jgi:tRNA A-37 threonylcarbamoyl transferase component Bud32
VVLWSYIITERFGGDNLHFYLVKQRPDQAACEKIKAALQRLVDRMGEKRITHGDLKPSNFVMNDRGQAALIDLDAMKVHRFGPGYQRRRAKDLEAFARRILNGELKAAWERD